MMTMDGNRGPLLELTNVTKRYEGPDGRSPQLVLAGVDLLLDAGRTLAITGPSGSGKSTLLNIIGALDRPTGGSVSLSGRDLSRCDDDELAAVRRQEVGFVFQLHHLLPQCSALENVLVPTLAQRPGRARRAQLAQRAEHLLDRVGLGDRLDYRPGELSGGQRQRVAVVRALINRPRLLLADEPTGSLDAEAGDSLMALLLELNAEADLAIIMVTHWPALARRMERVMELTEGTLEAEACS